MGTMSGVFALLDDVAALYKFVGVITGRHEGRGDLPH